MACRRENVENKRGSQEASKRRGLLALQDDERARLEKTKGREPSSAMTRCEDTRIIQSHDKERRKDCRRWREGRRESGNRRAVPKLYATRQPRNCRLETPGVRIASINGNRWVGD